MKTHPFPYAVLLACCLCLLMAVTANKKRPTAFAASEDSLLLNAIVPQFLSTRPKGFVIQRYTLSFKHIREQLYPDAGSDKYLNKAAPQAFQDFARRNGVSSVIPPLALGRPLIVVEDRDIEAVFKHGTWEDFYRKYPHTGGYLKITLPGYSTDRTAALVYIERSSGGLDGEGTLLLLKKKDGKWTLANSLGGWVS